MTITAAEAISASPWTDLPRPATPDQWVRRAEEVAAILEVGGSIGQLLGYHYPWSELPALYGDRGQRSGQSDLDRRPGLDGA